MSFENTKASYLNTEAEFDQGEVLATLEMNAQLGYTALSVSNIQDVKFGICLALSGMWLRAKKANSKAAGKGRVGGLSTNKAARVQGIYQDIESRKGGFSTKVLEEAYYEGEVGRCTATEVLADGTPLNEATVAERMLATKKLPLLFAYRWGDGSGHAVGAYFSSGKIFGAGRHLYLFDPNCGECKVAEGKVTTFFSTYFDDVTSAFKGQRPGTCLLYTINFA